MYDILKEERDFFVINKYTEIDIHNNKNSQGLISHLRHDLSRESIFPVHRLDKATSGLLICAKSHEACSSLSQLFAEKAVEKFYLALSDKKPKKKQGLVVGDLQKTRNGSWKLSKTLNNPSVTQFFSYGVAKGKRLFLLKPYTGKTHQLRVVMKSLGSPILGDTRYGQSVSTDLNITDTSHTGTTNTSTTNTSTTNTVKRMHLHAFRLSFTYQHRDFTFQHFPEGDLFEKRNISVYHSKISES